MSKHLEEAGGTYFCGGKVWSTFFVQRINFGFYFGNFSRFHDVTLRLCSPFHVGCIVGTFDHFLLSRLLYPFQMLDLHHQQVRCSGFCSGEWSQIVGNFL